MFSFIAEENIINMTSKNCNDKNFIYIFCYFLSLLSSFLISDGLQPNTNHLAKFYERISWGKKLQMSALTCQNSFFYRRTHMHFMIDEYISSLTNMSYTRIYDH